MRRDIHEDSVATANRYDYLELDLDPDPRTLLHARRQMLTRRTFLGLAAATVTLAIPGVADADRRRRREPRWGACPNGTYGANAATTLAKWPDSKAMRLFIPTGAGPRALPNIRVISWSNKPPLPGTSYVNPRIKVPTDTKTVVWTPWHEIDSRVARGEVSLADYRTLMHRIASQRRSDRVKLGIVTTAWGITPGAGNRDWRQYESDAATEWGADFDGVYATSTSYPNDIYLRALDVLDDIRSAGYRISVPEFGAPLASWDPTGTARAEWMLEWAERFANFGMRYVCLFDHTNEAYSVNDAAGIGAWRSVIRD